MNHLPSGLHPLASHLQELEAGWAARFVGREILLGPLEQHSLHHSVLLFDYIDL